MGGTSLRHFASIAREALDMAGCAEEEVSVDIEKIEEDRWLTIAREGLICSG